MKKHFKLPRKFYNNWIDALESGKFSQGKASLLDTTGENQYCCLGVACKTINIPDAVLIERGLLHELPKLLTKGIPQELLEFSNEYNSAKLPQLLANLNDGMTAHDFNRYEKMYPDIKFPYKPKDDIESIAYTFADIAKFIKKNVEVYD